MSLQDSTYDYAYGTTAENAEKNRFADILPGIHYLICYMAC